MNYRIFLSILILGMSATNGLQAQRRDSKKATSSQLVRKGALFVGGLASVLAGATCWNISSSTYDITNFVKGDTSGWTGTIVKFMRAAFKRKIEEKTKEVESAMSTGRVAFKCLGTGFIVAGSYCLYKTFSDGVLKSALNTIGS